MEPTTMYMGCGYTAIEIRMDVIKTTTLVITLVTRIPTTTLTIVTGKIAIRFATNYFS